MEAKISNASFEGKSNFKLPEGAEIIKKTVNISVQEIENGFIIRKSFDIQYVMPVSDDSKYEYYNKQWYSKTNPLTIKIDNKEMSLADKLD